MTKESVVYHGSPTRCFDVVTPKRNVRSRIVEGVQKVIFDEISFHATPHRWIGLAYTYQSEKQWFNRGRTGWYNMGVSLYENNQKVAVYGAGSLEESLNVLYGAGGCLYVFEAIHFFRKNGLGTLEVITQKPIRPVRIEYIEDPVQALRDHGVQFVFFDESIKP